MSRAIAPGAEKGLLMALRRLVATMFAVAVVVTGASIGLTGAAFAGTPSTATVAHVTSGNAPVNVPHKLTKAQMAAAVALPQTDAAAPNLSCSYGYICGRAANGNSFAYTKCGVVYTLPNLVGDGPVNNNQTPGTLATFYDINGDLYDWTYAPEQYSTNWTPYWYAIAC